MKKIKSILLAVLFAMLCITACTGQRDEDTKIESSKDTKKKSKKKKNKKKGKKKETSEEETEEETEEESEDYTNVSDYTLAGTAWIADNDGSYWEFRDDMSFYWYKDVNVTNDNYFGGTYDFLVGEDGLDILDSGYDGYEYAVTKNDILDFLATSTDGYLREDFLCFEATYTTYILDGAEQMTESTMIPYYGFFSPDGKKLVIVSMATGYKYEFTKAE